MQRKIRTTTPDLCWCYNINLSQVKMHLNQH